MKIDKLDTLTNLMMPEKKETPHKAGGTEFRKILDEVRANQAAENQKLSEYACGTAGSSDGPLGVYSLPPFTDFENPVREHSRMLQTADRMLNVLEQYQKKLGDPEVSLKTLYPIIQSLSSELQGMNEGTENLPENDPLKKILGEIGVLTAVQVEKFNRGEYVS